MQVECKVENAFQQITIRQVERITEIIIRKAIRKMKNKKAAYRLSWKAEWIKGGREMVKILYILFNRIKTENQTPKQWQLTTVTSIHIAGAKENIQENPRGIVLVNIVSKIYESTLKIQNENNNENMSPMQTAGKKQISTVANLIILNLIIKNQRENPCKTYLGYSPGAIKSLYETSKTSNIVVDTPVGKKSNITVEQVVNIFGSIMCFVSTSKVNTIQEAVKYQYRKVEIGMLVFMDDTVAVGTADNIRKEMEKG